MKKKEVILHSIDIYAGLRLREARLLRGLNQSELGKALSQPITFQQVQKYERGTNRMSVSRLCEFADILQLPVIFFLPKSEIEALPPLSLQESRLLENYRELTPDVKKAVTDLLNALRQS
jgi:transcriptional regulator with XRE-family HTH domain